MKSKLKGFTLVELVVVMAIMGILMVGIMQMFKPIRTIYVDSTQYEAQRTAQNGVVQYITESVKYATDMGIYTNNSASSAVDDFAAQYCTDYAIDSAKVSDVTAEIQKYAEVIIIDNSTQHYSKRFTGRLIRRKVDMDPTTASAIGNDPSITTGEAKVIDATSTGEWRTALGEAYYGENTYSINISFKDVNDDKKVDDGMFKVLVSSTRNGKRDISQRYKDTDGTIVDKSIEITNNATRGEVLCRNLVTGDNGVTKAGIFDVSKYDANDASFTSSDTPGAVTCIVFLNNEGKDKVLAVS